MEHLYLGLPLMREILLEQVGCHLWRSLPILDLYIMVTSCNISFNGYGISDRTRRRDIRKCQN